MATAVHNNSKNSTTGFAPNELLIGWEPPLATGQRSESKNQTVEEYLSNMRRNRLMAIHALNKVAHRVDVSPNRWTTGQLVWLEGKNLPLPHGTAKLAPRRHGPFKVTQIISPVAVQLELPPQWNIHPVFHSNLLTPYTETPSHGPNFTRPPPDLIDGEEEYEVEQIRSHRTWGRSRTLQYLIKWKGYPESDNTWENADQIHAPELIELYHQALARRGLKARRVRIEEEHSPTISPPPTHPPPFFALVWSTAHERNNRSACNPLTPLVPSPCRPRTHMTQTSSSATSTGHLSILQTNTGSSVNLPSIQHPPVPTLSTQCPPLAPTTPQTSLPSRHPSNFLPALIPRLQCHSHLALSVPHSSLTPTSITRCSGPSPMVSSKPLPIARPALVWPPNATKIAFTTSSRRSSTTKRPSTIYLRGMSSITGRSLTSRSQLAMGFIKRPSGYGSTTTAQSQGTTAHKAPTNNPTRSTFTPRPTSASTRPLNHSRLGSSIYSQDPGATSRYFSKRWLIRTTGALLGRLPGTASSTTTSQRWPSRSRSTSAIWTPHVLASAAARPASCSRAPPNDSPPCKTYRGRSGPYAQDGRRPPICHGESTSVPHHWRTSRMSADVHHRVEGDVTGLRVACRADAHVSCATGHESAVSSE
jgi:Chromo (CHRromatin Organisation MOdifier) domain